MLSDGLFCIDTGLSIQDCSTLTGPAGGEWMNRVIATTPLLCSFDLITLCRIKLSLQFPQGPNCSG